MDTLELTKGEAYSVAEFIDFNLFTAIRNDVDWDNMRALRNLVNVYEKCCILSGYFGCADTKPGEEN